MRHTLLCNLVQLLILEDFCLEICSKHEGVIAKMLDCSDQSLELPTKPSRGVRSCRCRTRAESLERTKERSSVQCSWRVRLEGAWWAMEFRL